MEREDAAAAIKAHMFHVSPEKTCAILAGLAKKLTPSYIDTMLRLVGAEGVITIIELFRAPAPREDTFSIIVSTLYDDPAYIEAYYGKAK